MIKLTVNGVELPFGLEPDMPLLWALRDRASLTGTKFGCGMGLCGACTVHIDGQAVRSCVTPVAAAEGKSVTTIEGLSGPLAESLKSAWIAEQVPQCGYCQPGQIMAAAAFLKANPNPGPEQIRAGITNLCRCGTYLRIERAIQRAANETEADHE